MASQFVTQEEVLNWLYEYPSGDIEEDGGVESIADFLTTFSEGYIVDAVGTWILTTEDPRVLSKVRLLIQAITADLYSSRSLTDEQATHRSARIRYLYQGTLNQLNVLQPPIADANNGIVNAWDYL